jgi:hypothetical protein
MGRIGDSSIRAVGHSSDFPMKVHQRSGMRLSTPVVANGAHPSNVQGPKRRRLGLALEPGEVHHSAELEELVETHRQRPAVLKRKKSRRKGDAENPEEGQNEQALETETMVLQAYTRAAKNLVVKVGARDRRSQQDQSGSGSEAHQDHSGGESLRVVRVDGPRGASRKSSLDITATGKRLDLDSAQAGLFEIAQSIRQVGTGTYSPIDRAMALIRHYLASCDREPIKSPLLTLQAVRARLIEEIHHGTPEEGVRPAPQSDGIAQQVELFHLLLPLLLLQLQRPRRDIEMKTALARTSALLNYR